MKDGAALQADVAKFLAQHKEELPRKGASGGGAAGGGKPRREGALPPRPAGAPHAKPPKLFASLPGRVASPEALAKLKASAVAPAPVSKAPQHKQAPAGVPPPQAAGGSAGGGAGAPSSAPAAPRAAAPGSAYAETKERKRGKRRDKRSGGEGGEGSAPAAGPTPAVYESELKRLSTGSVVGKLPYNAGNWHEVLANELALPALDESEPLAGRKRPRALPVVPPPTLERFKAAAAALLKADVDVHESKRAVGASNEARWMRTVLSSGTASDKLAAMTLLVQGAPFQSLRYLDSLLSLAKKKSRRESQQAVEALKDLFITNLLPGDRKLLAFEARLASAAAGGLAAVTPLQLVAWYFEDAVKARYADMLEALQAHLGDAILHFKTSALTTVAELLRERPEQEAALLALLVNKLGDPERRVASKAQYLLLQLVMKHEAMKPIVAREVKQFLFRPHVSAHAQQYAVTFLNQMPLHASMPTLAADLITTYISLFAIAVEAGTLDAKIVSALLTGVNRAFPYAEGAPDAFNAHGAIEAQADQLFGVVFKGSFSTAIQALTLLQAVTARRMKATEAALRAAGVDPEDARKAAEIVRERQYARAKAAAAAGSEGGDAAAAPPAAPEPAIPEVSDAFVDRFYRNLYAKITIEDLEHTSKHGLFLNLLFKALKADPLPGRVRALLKRLIQVAAHLPAHFAAGCVYLAAELVRSRPVLIKAITEAENLEGQKRLAAAAQEQEAADAAAAVALGAAAGMDEDDEDNEDDEDEDSDDDADSVVLANASAKAARAPAAAPAPATSAAVAALESALDADSDDEAPAAAAAAPAAAAGTAPAPSPATIGRYDPLKREPRYAGAEGSCLWELTPLALHYHPAVRSFTDHVLTRPRQALAYGGDPLTDFAPMAFLDRYVYKNPKTKYQAGSAGGAGIDLKDELAVGYAIVQGHDIEALKAVAAGLVHGGSLMQRRGPRHGRVDVEAPATSEAFAAKAPEQVRAEDLFLHQFFRTRAAQDAVSGRKKRAAELDAVLDSEAAEGAAVASDEEDAADAFADQLAQDLLRTSAGDPEDGEDDVDFTEGWDDVDAGSDDGGDSDDDSFADDDEDDEDDDEEEAAPARRSRKGAAADSDDEEDDDAGDDDSDEEFSRMLADGAEDDSDDEEGGAGGGAGGFDDEDDDDEEEEEEVQAPPAKRPRQSAGSRATFVEAPDSDEDEDAAFAAFKGGKKGGKSGGGGGGFGGKHQAPQQRKPQQGKRGGGRR